MGVIPLDASKTDRKGMIRKVFSVLTFLRRNDATSVFFYRSLPTSLVSIPSAIWIYRAVHRLFISTPINHHNKKP